MQLVEALRAEAADNWNQTFYLLYFRTLGDRQNQDKETYAKWQYRKGEDTIRFFLEARTAEEMFRGKQVLDMGCGAAGKSLYYCSLGAEKVTGVEIVAHYEQEANALAAELGFADRFQFVCASAFELPFPDSSFDTIIMNDFMEHVSDPARTLKEALRLIRPRLGGSRAGS